MNLLVRTSSRHHLSRPTRLLLTLAGISSAVALLVATSLLNSALRESIELSAKGVGGGAAFEVTNPVRGGVTHRLARAIARTPGVAAAVPMVRTTTELRENEHSQRIAVLGVPSTFDRLFRGRLGPAAEIARLRRTETLLGPLVEEGEPRSVSLETPRGYRRIGPVSRLPPVPFMDLNGGAFAMMNIRAASRLFAQHGQVDAVYVVAAEGVPKMSLRARLQALLRGRAVLSAPSEQGSAYRRTFDSLAQLTELGAAGALWVALFTVFNTMSMSLLERRRSIALLSTLGASRRQLSALFLGEGAVHGAIGSLVGVGLGYLLAKILLSRVVTAYPFLPLASSSHLKLTLGALATTTLAGILMSVVGAAAPVGRTLQATSAEGLSPDPPHEWAWRRSRFGVARLLAGTACVGAVALAVLLHLLSGSNGWLASVMLGLLLTGLLLILPPVVRSLIRLMEQLLRRLAGASGLLAVGGLLKNPGRTTLIVGVLSLSLCVAIALGAALSSFESTMTSVFAIRYGPPLYVTAASFSGVTSDQPLSLQAVEEIRHVAGVHATYPERHLPFEMDGRQAVAVMAPMGREARDGFTNSLTATRGAPRDEVVDGLAHGGVVLSAYTADVNHVGIGDRFPLPGIPQDVRPKIVGLYDDVLSIQTMYMERATYVRVSGDGSADRIAVAPERSVSAHSLARRLRRYIQSRHIPAVVETRSALLDSVLSNVRAAFAIGRAVQFAALVIASFIVASTMLTTIAERGWELAIFRTLGMTSGRVRVGVFVEALVIGLIGSLLALFVGLATGILMIQIMNAQFFWAVPYSPSGQQLWVAMATAMAAVLIAAFLPARTAGRAPVVTMLRTP